jgi:hypothetical protein
MSLADTPGSVGTPKNALIDDIFGTDERDHHDYDDSMDVDPDADDDSEPIETPSVSASASVGGITPASPAAASPRPGAIVLDHASGPFLKGKAGPIILDRFTTESRKD